MCRYITGRAIVDPCESVDGEMSRHHDAPVRIRRQLAVGSGLACVIFLVAPVATAGAGIRHPAPTLHIAPTTGPPGTTVHVTGQIQPGDTCRQVLVTLGHGAAGAGDVHHVATSRGSFSTEFTLAGDAPDGTWPVRAFCDYGSDGAEADFIVTSTLPRTGGELGLLAALGGFLLAAGAICFAPRRPGPTVAKDMASGQRR
jgi:hypothetical protein